MKLAVHGGSIQGLWRLSSLSLESITDCATDGDLPRLTQDAIILSQHHHPSSDITTALDDEFRLALSGAKSTNIRESFETESPSTDTNASRKGCNIEMEQLDFFSRLHLEGFPMTEERVRPWQRLKKTTNKPKNGKVLVKCSGRHCYGALIWNDYTS